MYHLLKYITRHYAYQEENAVKTRNMRDFDYLVIYLTALNNRRSKKQRGKCAV